jgi:hypothetical protein
MIKKLTGMILLLALAACDANLPKPPRLEGQWQCQNGIMLVFKGPKNYTLTSATGEESTGVYKLTVGEDNQHRIEWNPNPVVNDTEAVPPLSLPTRFRYFETGKLARLLFYTHVADESIPCERRL